MEPQLPRVIAAVGIIVRSSLKVGDMDCLPVEDSTTATKALTLTIAGCGGSNSGGRATVTAPTGATQQPGQGSALTACVNAPASGRAPAGASTDLTKKPVVEVPDTAAPCELQTIDLVVGKGAEAKAGSTVSVKYLGLLYQNGKEFDSSWSRGAKEVLPPFQLGGHGVIDGFDKGTQGMRVGGRREVLIPSKDGYGAAGQGTTIPADANLIFVIDLLGVS